MGNKTLIKWADSTWNPWEGCTKVSAGCANCYAEARDKRFTGGLHWGNGAPRRKSESAIKDALAFNRKPWICDECGEAVSKPTRSLDTGWCEKCQTDTAFHRRRIFSLSLGDWLDDEVPIEWFVEMMQTVLACEDVTWILCTKRPENWLNRMTLARDWSEVYEVGKEGDDLWVWLSDWLSPDCDDDIPRNIILLTSVENQDQADKRIPELLQIPAACHGLSLEPLLGPVLLPPEQELSGGEINWLIIGGESGLSARPCNLEWIRSLVKQGHAAGVATFVKQLGAMPVQIPPQNNNYCDGSFMKGRFNKKADNPAEWPADLRVQHWPKGF